MSKVDRTAEDVYREFAECWHSHVIAHPTCEICESRPSVRITRWGPILAACGECLAEEMEGFEAFVVVNVRRNRSKGRVEGITGDDLGTRKRFSNQRGPSSSPGRFLKGASAWQK